MSNRRSLLTWRLLRHPIRLALFVFGLAAGRDADATSFAQQSCGDDLKRLSEKRETELNKINALVRAAKGKPMNPGSVLRPVGRPERAETALIAYMEKNKDWCGVPDDALDGLKENHVKSLAFSDKACAVAAQMKKQQAAGAPMARRKPSRCPPDRFERGGRRAVSRPPKESTA